MGTDAGIIGPIPDGADPDEYDRLRRRVLWKIPNGLFLVGSRDNDRRNLMTASFVTQVAMEPKLVAVSLDNDSFTHELVTASGVFALCYLKVDDRGLVRKFVKPASDDRAAHTLNGEQYFDAPVTAAPVLAASLCYLDCSVHSSSVFTSHTLFVGEVVAAAFCSAEDEAVLSIHDTRMNYGG